MKSIIILIAVSIWGMQLNAQHLVEVGKGYSRTSVNTTIFRNSSLVTDGVFQYISYYDAEGYLTLGKRKLTDSQWTLHRTQYKGKVTDAHNVISLGIDGKGYLHVAFDHHGNQLNYCKSTAPGALSLGEKTAMTGKEEDDVTYPEFYQLAEGNLLFAYRSGASGKGNLIMNRYDVNTGTWERIHDVLIDGEGKRNAYWQLYVNEAGVIHLSWVWRETWMVETNHDLCYARSTDNGKTWQKSDGTLYTLPINQQNAEYACRIPQNSELINQTSMTADSSGNPYIATYWREQTDSVPQYRLVWHDGKQWHTRQISNRTQPFTLKGGGTKMIPISRPRIIADQGKAWVFFRDTERGSKISMAYTDNLNNGNWNIKDITDFSVGAWEPSFDLTLWEQQRSIHLFVQTTYQGDGEQTVSAQPTPVYVLEVHPDITH